MKGCVHRKAPPSKKSRQEFVTSREPPQLDADGDLNGSRRKVLFLLAGLQLDQHLVELSKGEHSIGF